MRAILLPAAIVLAALAATSALPAVDGQAVPGWLQGEVAIRSPLVAPPVEGQPHARPREHRRAVVFFEAPPHRNDGLVSGRAEMRQRDATFDPHLMAITAGTTVAFPNDDRTYHNVFSLSKPRRFDLGRYAAGRSKDVRFERPGLVRVFCDIHAHMNAFIHVFDHRFYAATNERGRYRIDRVPPGTYRVTAWYEGVDQQTREVVVHAGAAAELDFVLH
ncbi:MAG TPA: carboxypeptidase regulatory-like domain-containing protein [Vicinamibacterales bacterium]|nr:carboxypeptidase regulatory-like domain-containing protein [Acidobacteriota bacterium]HOC18067.1 carboxypeptidase regulatory-like domain-containing protein [Vicinamibacterales bacterium]